MRGITLAITTAVCFILHTGVAFADIHLTLTLRDGTIQPTQFNVVEGQTVHIHVQNQGKNTHNLVIPDFYVFTQNLSSGGSVDTSFMPTKQGTFSFYSDTGGKPEAGMKGTLKVSAKNSPR